MKIFSLLATMTTLALAACTGWTAFGKQSELGIETEPPGAVVTVNGDKSCQTPCTLTVIPTKPARVSIVKEGYQSFEATIGTKVNKNLGTGLDASFTIFDIVIGDYESLGYDAAYAATGNYHKFDQNPLRVKLIPIAAKETP